MKGITPGPWTWGDGFKGLYGSGQNNEIISYYGYEGMSMSPGSDIRANAYLIAAAPELLDACEKMVEWDARENDYAIDFYARMELCREAFNAVRAAIAKATQP